MAISRLDTTCMYSVQGGRLSADNCLYTLTRIFKTSKVFNLKPRHGVSRFPLLVIVRCCSHIERIESTAAVNCKGGDVQQFVIWIVLCGMPDQGSMPLKKTT